LVRRAPDVKCSPACKHIRIPQLKEPQLVLPTFTKAQVTRLVNWKPKKIFWQRRLHLLILFLLDTGCRVDEALSVRVREIDFDNLLLTLDGKGRKQRIVTFSFELRRALYLHKAIQLTSSYLLDFSGHVRDQLSVTGVDLAHFQRASEGTQHSASSRGDDVVNG
jgi:integrase